MAVLQTEFEERTNPAGGTGTITLEHFYPNKQFGGEGATFAKVTIPPGAGIGYHQHVGNGEIYHFLEGRGIYNDNGTEIPVSPGMTTYCPDGEYHGVKNDGDVDLVFVAQIK